MAKIANLKKAYGQATGPFGFPMQEAVAKEVDQIFKGLPKECKELGYFRGFKAPSGDDMKLQEGERCDISLITNVALDRDREVVDAAGIDWSQFKKNPIVTFAHSYDSLPVGRSLWIKRQKEDGHDGWLGKTWYIDRPEGWQGEWFADAVWHMVKSLVLRGKSIGFIAQEVSPPSEKEIKARPELAGSRCIIRKSIALEYAIAPVQSNPDATTVAVAKAVDCGLKIPQVLIDAMHMVIPDTVEEYKGIEFVEDVVEKKSIDSAELKSALMLQVPQLINQMDVKGLVNKALDQMRGKV